MFRRLVHRLHAFGSDRRGNVLLLFGLTIIPTMLAIGAAVDYSRALNVKQRLGAALDAAALAVGGATGLTEQQLKDKAQAYFEANYPEAELGTPGELSVSVNDFKVTMSATANVGTTLMHLAGMSDMAVGANVEVTKKTRKIEVVMVLDNTGSMKNGGKIGALKTAATQLVDTLFDGEMVSSDLMMGLVPFAAAVNIGSEHLNSGWIDTQAESSIAAEDFSPGTNVLTLYNEISNRSWNGCVRARRAPFDTLDTAPAVASPDTLWVPYFAPDEPDVYGNYANRYASDGDYEGAHYDYDARQRYTGKYEDLSVNHINRGPNYNCRMPAVTPMINKKSDLISAIDDMVATGSTVIPAGLAWGWRLISPTEPFTEGGSSSDEGIVKAIVLLTDGKNSVAGGLKNNHNNSRYSAYGYARSGHLGMTNGNNATSTLNAKTTTLCNNIKAQNIRLYTITFKLNDGGTKNLMRNCASKSSMYYDAASNTNLQTVFEDIAKGLSELRISK